jgi:hypothetical protein
MPLTTILTSEFLSTVSGMNTSLTAIVISLDTGSAAAQSESPLTNATTNESMIVLNTYSPSCRVCSAVIG